MDAGTAAMFSLVRRAQRVRECAAAAASGGVCHLFQHGGAAAPPVTTDLFMPFFIHAVVSFHLAPPFTPGTGKKIVRD
jgi:hypothetical protein